MQKLLDLMSQNCRTTTLYHYLLLILLVGKQISRVPLMQVKHDFREVNMMETLMQVKHDGNSSNIFHYLRTLVQMLYYYF